MTPNRGVPIVAAPAAAVADEESEWEKLDPELRAILEAASARIEAGEPGIPVAEVFARLDAQREERRRRGH